MQPKRIVAVMLREEWRLHERFFPRGRFALFPIVVASLVAGTVVALLTTGVELGRIYAGLHGLAFVFGLHTGSVALIGRDSVRNLLGDLTLVVFSSRTLPVSERGLIAAFVIKDVAYYAVLFLLPMAFGVGGGLLGVGAVAPMAAIPSTIALWLALGGMFVLGLVVTVAGIGLVNRGIPRSVVLLGVVVFAGAVWRSEVSLAALTGYGVFVEPTFLRALSAVTTILIVGAVGALTFEVRGPRQERQVRPAYRRWRDRLRSPVATRSMLDLHRSSGGFGKVAFSALILLGVTVVLLDLATTITGVSPSSGVALGAILGLTGFTTYNWLTQFDEVDTYRSLPIDVPTVFRAKLRAFILLGPTIGIATYAVGVAWRGTPLLEGIAGGMVLLGILGYIVGLTVTLTGLSPNEFLFDARRFAAFGVAMAVPLIPLLVVAFVFAPLGSLPLLLVTGSGLGMGIIGLALYRRAGSKWAAHYRRQGVTTG